MVNRRLLPASFARFVPAINSPYRRVWVWGFFLALLALGLSIYGHYGISWDEFTSRANGMISLRYVHDRFMPTLLAGDPVLAEHRTPLVEYYDRDYGVLFETPVSFIERLCGMNDPHSQFLYRHMMTFLVCFGGVIAFFLLVQRRFSDWRLGLFGALWLVLSPRLFGEWFYNDKDAVFMAVFIIAMNTGVRFLIRPTWGRAAVHALACAATIDIRIMGIVMPALTLGFFAIRVVNGQVAWRGALAALGVYLVLLPVFVVAMWPYLWEAPLDNFLLAFENMKHFRWEGGILYLGDIVQSSNLPWHYAPVWIAVTTPILYVLSFLMGAVAIVLQFGKRLWRFWQTNEEMQDMMFLALAVGPILAVIVLHSVLYDGWRQLYFVYPGFLLVALSGWVRVWNWQPSILAGRFNWSAMLALGTAGYLVYVAAVMVRMHPYQSLYFNALAGKDVAKRFEVDYWGISYREGLKHLLKTDSRSNIKVYGRVPITHSWHMLKPAERERISIIDDESQADYFVTIYRTQPEDLPYKNEVHQIKVNGTRVLSIFKLK